jgi:nucleoside-diphosphate-sugar epimerase
MVCEWPDPTHADGAPVVVLGGNGFLGRRICERFVAADVPVISVSRRPATIPDTRSIAIDLASSEHARIVGMLTAMRPAAIINAAGAVWAVTEDDLHHSNVTLVERLVEAVAALPWRPRLVQLGSVHEYGAVAEGQLIREDIEPRPLSPYGRTKLQGTRVVLKAIEAGDIDATVLRLANVSGAGTPRHSLLGLVGSQLAEAYRERRTAVLRLAPLKDRRDFIDVRDVTDAIFAAAYAPAPGPVLNIGRGEAVSVRWLVEELITASAVPAELDEQPDRPAGIAGGKSISFQQADITAATQTIGWQPRRALGESLAALWAHARDHDESEAAA